MTGYCMRCGIPHDGVCRRTVAEQLDATTNGQEFGAVLMRLFAALERHRDTPTNPADHNNG